MRPRSFPLYPRVVRSIIGATVAIAAAALLSREDVRLVPNALWAAPAIATSDSSDVVGVIQRFHAAVVAGDSAAALALLADDAVVLESGGKETRAEFRAHHLPADIAFAQAVPSKQGPILVRVQGDVAWASTTSVSEGEFRGRKINSTGAELMVLARESSGWKIRAIHWSSRARRQQ